MDQNLVLILVVAAIALVAILGFVLMSRKRHTQHLQQAFGSEYGRVVDEKGRTRAEKELLERKQRFDRALVRDLSDDDRRRYTDLWHSVQNRFVDSPMAAVTEADQLISEVMRMRGYPAGDFDQRVADVAIGHPGLVDHYRSACTIADKSRHGKSDTEELRQALVHYRALFEELLSATPAVADAAAARPRFRAKHA
jgi:hypothetical protein